jgi:hypothetical protein
MPLDKTQLLDFLGVVEEELSRQITLVGAGGTAMTLLNLKPSTIDIDFTGPGEYIADFKEALKNISHGFKIDLYKDGVVFSQILPEDYLEKSIRIRQIGRIELCSLQPLDILVTKVGRLDDRDMQDIEACIKGHRLTKETILRRARQVQYVGREANYTANLRRVIGTFFREK